MLTLKYLTKKLSFKVFKRQEKLEKTLREQDIHKIVFRGPDLPVSLGKSKIYYFWFKWVKLQSL